jgi:hypothetical protein
MLWNNYKKLIIIIYYYNIHYHILKNIKKRLSARGLPMRSPTIVLTSPSAA